MKKPFLSIIIPAFNEANRLPETLRKINAYLLAQDFSTEIIVVENGSTDGTYAIANDMREEICCLTVLHEENRGKGWAVRQGMFKAHGKYRFICDADLSMPIEEISNFIPPAELDAPIAIGSREAPGAVRYAEPRYRHLIGRAFNWFVRILLLPELNDTQCGFKLFREDAANAIFPHLTISGWTFDVEALFIAHKLGFKIVEIPIQWHHHPHSTVKVLRDSFWMGIDLLKICLNNLKGKYPANA
ncbi:MAG: glycosyltransferase family 2 protein [Anaerolineaceae bacterium]|nr:glycosyltransferase family 2 protein [Anaerolineaceae bacterium]